MLGTIGLTNLFGSNSFNSTAQWGLKPGDNVGGNFGHSLNLWSGQTDSANLQYKHNLALQHDAQNFAKWQMANAHQQEVADLEAAGLNPVLSSGGQGASAGGVSANATGPGAGGMDPIGMVGAIVNMLNSTKQTKALVEKTEAETSNIDQDTLNKGQEYILRPEIVQIANELQRANTGKVIAEKEKIMADKLAQEFMNKMREMDVNKRSSDFVREKMIYQKQMQRALILAGYGNTNMDLVWTKFGERIKQLSPLAEWQPHMNSSSYNYSPVSVNY